jgi:hypothetical protein
MRRATCATSPVAPILQSTDDISGTTGAAVASAAAPKSVLARIAARRKRSPILAGTAILARPPLAVRMLLFRGARVDPAATIVAGASAGTRTFVLLAHVQFSGSDAS